MARIKDTSVEAVKAGADFVEVVSEPHAAAQGRRRATPAAARSTRSARRRFSVNAVDKLYYCFGCGAKGDLITFVRETEGLDFVGAIEWLAERFRIPLEYEESSPAAGRARRTRRDAAARAARPGGDVLRAHALGLAGGWDGARLPQGPRPERGGLPRVPARPRARRQLARAQGAREGLHAARSCARPG